MTHLKIIQGNLLPDTEEVSMDIINKLYELAVSGDLDQTSELKGYLHLLVGDRAKIEYLTNMFQNKLFITANNYIIPFEDQNMVTYLNSIGVGSNGVITEADAAAATIVANSANTTVTKFNELKYFTQITQSRGGLSGTSSGWVRFKDWTALEEVDLSNFTSIGHNHGSTYEDTFCNCTNLKKVTVSNKLADFGYYAFFNCLNLEEISGLDGTLTVYRGAFYNCLKLKNSCFSNVEILFPIGVSDNISREPFYKCSLLTNITLSPANTYIPLRAFQGTGLQTINIPASVSIIDNDAFAETPLQGIDLSATSITEIPQECFCNCSSLTQVALPSSCLTLGVKAFSRCNNLATINLAGVTSIGSECFIGCRSLQLTQADLQNVINLGTSCFQACAAISGTFVLPHVNNIYGGALRETGIQSIDFTGSTFTSLSNDSLYKCKSLTSVTLPTSCTVIGNDAFSESSHLATINLGNITTIGRDAFWACTDLSSVNLDSCTSLGENAFRGTGLTSVDLSNSTITSLPKACFRECQNLGLVKLPASCTELGHLAFYACPNLQISASDLTRLTYFGISCFGSSGLTGELTFPNITRFEANAFDRTTVTKLDFTGSTFTSVGGYFGNGLQSLAKVILPDTVQEIAGVILAGCTGLQYIKCLAATPPTAAGVIGAYINNPTFKIYVPDASVNAYKAATYWSDHSARIFGLSQFATDFPNG